MKIAVEISQDKGAIIENDKLEGEIELRNVNFAYPSKPDVMVSKNVNITVKKNQIVALVGQSGCGKSSIINLIERFYLP